MLPEYVKFYYDKLPAVKKDIYMQMYNGLKNHKKRINIKTDLSIITTNDLQYIFTCLYNDTPSFYFVNILQSQYLKTPSGYIFIKDFIYSDSDIKKFDKLLIDGLANFKKKYINERMTDYEKELAIHDYLVSTVSYDEESIREEELKAKHGEIFNVLGPLLRKKAVCWGIACAFKLICDYCGVKCFVIIGDSLPIISNSPGHAWNIVRIDDENYHVDVTWDIKKKGDISYSYDYLNLDDHLIKLNHTWDDLIYPPCNALKYNYYNRNKLYVRTLEQIPDYVRNRIDTGETYITFKYANNMPPKNEILLRIRDGVQKSKKRVAYKYLINTETHNVYIELKN